MSNEIVIGLGHQVGVIYAIVVGFVAIGVLSAYDKAELGSLKMKLTKPSRSGSMHEVFILPISSSKFAMPLKTTSTL